MKAVRNLVFFGILSLAFGQIFVIAQENKPTPVVNETPKTPSVTNPDKMVPETSEKFNSNEKYRIGYQDTLEVQVFRNSKVELTQNVNVNIDGTISLPRIERPITAVCKTERELADLLVEYYKVYLKNPYVNVRAVDQRSQSFAVLGAVEKPGNFYSNRQLTLLELLSYAGGHDVNTAGSKIQIARIGNISGCQDSQNGNTAESQVEFLRFNLNDVLEGKNNPVMHPGDIVSILLAEEAYVVGNVLKQTKIVLREPKTLTQAIAEAGGVNSTANTGKVIIQRQEPGSDVKTELSYNLKDIRDRKIPDPKIQANDIVQVDTDKFKSFKKGFLGLMNTVAPTALYRIP